MKKASRRQFWKGQLISFWAEPKSNKGREFPRSMLALLGFLSSHLTHSERKKGPERSEKSARANDKYEPRKKSFARSKNRHLKSECLRPSTQNFRKNSSPDLWWDSLYRKVNSALVGLTIEKHIKPSRSTTARKTFVWLFYFLIQKLQNDFGKQR